MVTCKYKLLKYCYKNNILLFEEQTIEYLNNINADFEYTVEDLLFYDDLIVKLTASEYKLFFLRFEYGYTFAEIAKYEHLEEGTCKMRYYRILKKLKSLLLERGKN